MSPLDESFKTLLEMAFKEDLGDRGDVTSRSIFEDDVNTATLYSKDTGVLAGCRFFELCFKSRDDEISIQWFKNDGDSLKPGEKIAQLKGRTFALLEAERTGINFLAFLSGIASVSRQFAEAAEKNGRAVILDTRKTLPGYRYLSKYAVTVGGGQNHRMGLYDMAMIKDNHIDACGSITRAVEKIRSRWQAQIRIEVECRNKEEVLEAVAAGADVVMLDNMSPRDTAEAVALAKGRVQFEASGNMDLEKVAEYSPTGVDYISVGSLTHSVKAFDFSLKVDR